MRKQPSSMVHAPNTYNHALDKMGFLTGVAALLFGPTGWLLASGNGSRRGVSRRDTGRRRPGPSAEYRPVDEWPARLGGI